MRKIIVGARVSMDGVMEEPMGPSEGFKLGGWARPYQDQDCWAVDPVSTRSASKPWIVRTLAPQSAAHVRLHGGPAPVRRFLPELIELVWERKVNSGKVFDLRLPLDQVAEGYRAIDERRAIKALLRP